LKTSPSRVGMSIESGHSQVYCRKHSLVTEIHFQMMAGGF
jgi:hypothetical protein